MAIILAVVLYIQFKYLRPKRDDAIETALDRDEAYNAMTTAQSVSATLRDRGRNTRDADHLLIEAELAYDRNDFLKCIDASKRAKERLAIAPMATDDLIAADPGLAKQEEAQPEQPKISEARKLPPNYLESKFMISTAKDEIDRCAAEGRNVSESVCLLDEAKMAFECKEYDVALRKSLKAKKSTEAPSEPSREKVAEIVPPVKTVKRGVVNDTSKGGQCASCGTFAKDDDNFCAKCGKPILKKRVCPTCKADVSDDDVFCRKCGTEIRTAYQCPKCGFVATDDDPVCVKCGARFQN